jgi:hypothetical protein
MASTSWEAPSRRNSDTYLGQHHRRGIDAGRTGAGSLYERIFMSSTVLYVVASNGDVEPYCEFKNSHGGAMAVWTLLGEKYLPQPRPSWLSPNEKSLWSPFLDGALSALFKLAATPGTLEPWERITLLTTADHVVVPIAALAEVTEALETFYTNYRAQRDGYVFSIGDQAAALRNILQEGTWRGVCWNQTTLSDALWEGAYAEADDGERTPYNIDTMDQHWFLFEKKVPASQEPSTT